MGKAVGIGGLFFRSDDPEGLLEWYQEHLGLEMNGPVWMQQSGPTVFSPFPRNTEYFGNANQQWMLNLRVDDLTSLIRSLEKAGIAVETRPDEWDSEVGRFARVHDPEGNPVELWEPAGPAAASDSE